MSGPKSQQALERLRALAVNVRESPPNVRALARFASNTRCRLANVGFAARVDFDKLLEGTQYAVPFGQSPFALRRGTQFEERLRKDGHRPVLQLLGSQLGYDVEGARVENLRKGFAQNRSGMQQRAQVTEEVLRRVFHRDAKAPNLIDGAVFTREVAGVKSYFEADAVAARFDGPVHAGEIKSFPTVDGQAEPDKVGAALAQASIYVLLLRELAERVGGTRSAVAMEALLITPRNVGLEPTLSVHDVRREVDRADRILRSTPTAVELVEGLPGDLPTFAKVADKSCSEDQRVDTALSMAEKVGTYYQPECLSSCGMSKLCRSRAHDTGEISRIGSSLQRLLPGLKSLDRVHALAQGEPANDAEAAVAAQLTRAERLMQRLTACKPAPARFVAAPGKSKAAR
jgi:hypothetical protein